MNKLANHYRYIFIILLLLAFTSILYWKVIAGLVSISQLGYIPICDSFFSQDSLRFKNTSFFDAALVYVEYPFEVFVLNHLASFPALWNDLIGCGMSAIGNIQSRIFCPITILFPATNEYVYNIRILLELSLGGIGIALLALALRCSIQASIFVGISFICCPFILREFEFPFNYWLYPWAFWFLLNTCRIKNTFWILATALFLAFSIASSHAECMFFAISFGSLFALAMVFQEKIDEQKKSCIEFIQSCKALMLTGITTFALSAPILIPFSEYFHNAFIYKNDAASPWQCNIWTLITNLTRPICGYDSITIGAIAFVLIAFALISRSKTANYLLLVALPALLIVTRPFPLTNLLNSYPINGMYPLYCMAMPLIIGLLISAIGFDLVLRQINQLKNINLLIAILLTMTLLVFPIKLLTPSFSDYVPTRFIINNEPQWYLPCALLALIIFAVITLYRDKLPYFKNALPLVLIILNLILQTNTDHFKLPDCPQLKLPDNKIVSFLKEKQERMLSLELDCFSPDFPSLWNIKDFRLYSPTFPQRYLEFAHLSGARRNNVISWTYTPPLNRLLDAANIRYIVTRIPILPDHKSDQSSDALPKNFNLGIRLISITCNASNNELIVKSSWRVYAPLSNNYKYRLVVLDTTNHMISSGPWLSLIASMHNNNFLTKSYATCQLPSQWKNEQYVAKLELANIDQSMSNSFYIGRIKKESTTSTRFNLIMKSENNVRLYENKTALPECYLSNIVQSAANIDIAKQMMSKPSFDPHRITVIEGDNIPSSKTTAPVGICKLKRLSTDLVKIDVSTNQDTWLILTDSYYPGWSATIDNKPTTIYPANILFRAIFVPKGSHEVMFAYSPWSFRLGLILAIISLFIWATVLSIAWMRSRKSLREHTHN